MRRSIAMLNPRAAALDREQAMALLAELQEVERRLGALRSGLRRAPGGRGRLREADAIGPLGAMHDDRERQGAWSVSALQSGRFAFVVDDRPGAGTATGGHGATFACHRRPTRSGRDCGSHNGNRHAHGCPHWGLLDTRLRRHLPLRAVLPRHAGRQCGVEQRRHCGVSVTSQSERRAFRTVRISDAAHDSVVRSFSLSGPGRFFGGRIVDCDGGPNRKRAAAPGDCRSPALRSTDPQFLPLVGAPGGRPRLTHERLWLLLDPRDRSTRTKPSAEQCRPLHRTDREPDTGYPGCSRHLDVQRVSERLLPDVGNHDIATGGLSRRTPDRQLQRGWINHHDNLDHEWIGTVLPRPRRLGPGVERLELLPISDRHPLRRSTTRPPGRGHGVFGRDHQLDDRGFPVCAGTGSFAVAGGNCVLAGPSRLGRLHHRRHRRKRRGQLRLRGLHRRVLRPAGPHHDADEPAHDLERHKAGCGTRRPDLRHELLQPVSR